MIQELVKYAQDINTMSPMMGATGGTPPLWPRNTASPMDGAGTLGDLLGGMSNASSGLLEALSGAGGGMQELLGSAGGGIQELLSNLMG